MRRYLKNQEHENMLKDIDFYHVRENVYKKQLLDTGLDGSKKVVHKADKCLGNKIEDTVIKSNDDKIKKQEPVQEITNSPEKLEEVLNKWKKIIIKMEHYKISELLNDSTVSKFVRSK